MAGRSIASISENPNLNSTLNPNQYYRGPLEIMLRRREVGMSDRDVTHSDLVEITKQNGDFRKNYGVIVGAILYLRSINAARPRLFWWQAVMASIAVALGFWWR
jgi:hypothetical protein